MFNKEAEKIFGAKAKEYTPLLEKLENYAKGKFPLKFIYSRGPDSISKFIRCKEDLKLLLSFCIILHKAGHNPAHICQYFAENFKELITSHKALRLIIEIGVDAICNRSDPVYAYDALNKVKYMITDEKDLEIVVNLCQHYIREKKSFFILDEDTVGALLYLKDLINNYQDLAEMIELREEVSQQGLDPVGVYMFGLTPVKEILIKLKKKYKWQFYEIIKPIIFSGFLNKTFLDELIKSYALGKLAEKIKLLEKERDFVIDKGCINDELDCSLLYSLAGYSLPFSEFYKIIQQKLKIKKPSANLFAPFEITVKRMTVKLNSDDIATIKEWQSWTKNILFKHGNKEEGVMKKEILELQKKWDMSNDIAIERELIEQYIALCLITYRQLKRDILSDDNETAMTHFGQLFFDRIDSIKREILANPDRLLPLISNGEVNSETYESILNLITIEKQKLKKVREDKRVQLKDLERLNDKVGVKKTGKEIGQINFELKKIVKKEDIIKFNSKIVKDICTKLKYMLAKSRKKAEAVECFLFDPQKSPLDAIAGYISKDCTKIIPDFSLYFFTDYAHNIKIYRVQNGQKHWIGNIYLLTPEKNTMIIDAFQLATPTRYDTVDLWQKVAINLKKVANRLDANLYVSMFISNYHLITEGFRKAFPRAKFVRYQIDGRYRAFESYRENLFCQI